MTTSSNGATSDAVSSVSNTLCRYHMHGACKHGVNCPFSHDRTLSPSMTCRYYQHGMCRYGDRCRYNHVKHRTNSTHVSQSDPSHSSTNLCNKLKSTSLENNDEKLKRFDSYASQSKREANVLRASAKEFIPGQPYQGAGSYSSALRTSPDVVEGASAAPTVPHGNKDLLCPYAIRGSCYYGDQCVYAHGDVCELCGLPVLDPNDADQRATHVQECQKVLEQDMEMSFLLAQSERKECGVCMEVVVEKEPRSERRFGILSNCVHVFCLDCIRKWRKEKNFDSKAIRSCPECRTVSDFVTPSDYWVETREEKDALIERYKLAMKKKPCQYFKHGAGECPFNEHCFYEHAYPDGRLASPRPRRRRVYNNVSLNLERIQEILLWDFFEERENNLVGSLTVEMREWAERLFNALDIGLSPSLSDPELSDSDSD